VWFPDDGVGDVGGVILHAKYGEVYSSLPYGAFVLIDTLPCSSVKIRPNLSEEINIVMKQDTMAPRTCNHLSLRNIARCNGQFQKS
jgi:hypothetical protein